MNSQVLKIYSLGLSALEMKYPKLIIVTNYCWDGAPVPAREHIMPDGLEPRALLVVSCLMFQWSEINVSELGGTSRQYCKE